MKPLQADAILACLEKQGVRYVLIGGLAAILHGSPQVTFDADICPARDLDNLERLAAALRDMSARIRTPDVQDGLAFQCDAVFLNGVELLNLVTAFGDLDLSFVPSGTRGYGDLSENAIFMQVKGYRVAVASLEDIIRSKQAANRPKDQAGLPILRQLLQELNRRKPAKDG
jgi:hypothetical protein